VKRLHGIHGYTAAGRGWKAAVACCQQRTAAHELAQATHPACPQLPVAGCPLGSQTPREQERWTKRERWIAHQRPQRYHQAREWEQLRAKLSTVAADQTGPPCRRHAQKTAGWAPPAQAQTCQRPSCPTLPVARPTPTQTNPNTISVFGAPTRAGAREAPTSTDRRAARGGRGGGGGGGTPLGHTWASSRSSNPSDLFAIR
jgi:hypothetical protein